MFTPTTFEQYKAIWGFLSSEQKEAYVTSGDVRRIIHATNNQEVLGSNYSLESNKACVQSVYIWGPHDLPQFILGTAHEYDYERIENISAYVTKTVLGAGIQLEPRIIQALIKVNGGTMPAILDPVIPPVLTAEPSVGVTPEQPSEEDPTNDSGSEPQ